jgi:hypothetical protein
VTILLKAKHHLRLYINDQWGDEEKYIMQNMEGLNTDTRGMLTEGKQEEWRTLKQVGKIN